MRKVLLLTTLAAIFGATSLNAQAPFNTCDSININKINARTLVHGDMWYEPGIYEPRCEFPKGTGKHMGFVSALWMSAFDNMGTLYVAAQTYRQDGNDYWPGPIDSGASLTYANSRNWNKIWKVNRSDLQTFLATATHTTSNTPPAILTWPASGNAHAAGAGGVSLTIPAGRKMAPFIDLNSNGIYEPLQGEYPDVKGDQALWYVFTDNGPTHAVSMTSPLGVEVHSLAYAYNRGGLLDNVVYYEYEITNKSSRTLLNFRLAQFADMDLGYYEDDYIGFDSAHRMGIQYSAVAADGSSAGFPAGSYGTGAPVVGVAMVELPGDAGSSYVPAGNFGYYRNDNTVLGNPTSGVQYSNYMRGTIRNGDRFTNDFTGVGHVSQAYGSGLVARYVFNGDPGDTTKWSECVSGNAPGDRRFVISSNDFDLAPGQTKKVGMALLTTDTGQGGCPGVSFHDVKVVSDTAWHYYHHPLPTLAVDGPSAPRNINVKVYPNPAGDVLYVETPGYTTATANIGVFNMLGQRMNIDVVNEPNRKLVNLAAIPAGVYYLSYSNGASQKTIRFEKL